MISRSRHAMGMQIDEAWTYDQTTCVNRVLGLQWRLVDRHNLAIPDADRAYNVELRFRTDHPAVVDRNLGRCRHLGAPQQARQGGGKKIVNPQR